MLISQCRDALIRHRIAGQQDVGQRWALLNQSRVALIHTRSVGHKEVGQRVPISDKDCDALIPDRRFGQSTPRPIYIVPTRFAEPMPSKPGPGHPGKERRGGRRAEREGHILDTPPSAPIPRTKERRDQGAPGHRNDACRGASPNEVTPGDRPTAAGNGRAGPDLTQSAITLQTDTANTAERSPHP